MRLIYIHQYFTTNKGKSGTRSYDVAKYMVQAGHEVYMICGISETSGLKPLPWYKLYRKENIDGIKTIACNVSYSNGMSNIARMFSFIWFVILGTIVAFTIKKPDLVFATSTPIFVGIPGLIASKLKKAKFVFEVRDLWPESFLQGGWAKGDELYIRFMGWLEKFLYKKAEKVVLVSQGFKDNLIKRGFPAEKFEVVFLGADGKIFENVVEDNKFRNKYKLADKKIAIYTGAHGQANGLYYILDAASESKDRDDIAYVMIGEGGEKLRLINRAKELDLKNVIFADAVVKTDLPGILKSCNIGLMILRNIGARPVTPNKIFDYMFTGIPSIVNFEGPTIDMVLAENSGIFADPLSPKDLAEKVKYLVDNPTIAKQMGENGRKAALEKYDRKVISQQLIDIFEGILSSKK